VWGLRYAVELYYATDLARTVGWVIFAVLFGVYGLVEWVFRGVA
jgi:hypothetical protein